MTQANSSYATPERLREIADQIDTFGNAGLAAEKGDVFLRLGGPDPLGEPTAAITYSELATVFRAVAAIVERQLAPEEKYW